MLVAFWVLLICGRGAQAQSTSRTETDVPIPVTNQSGVEAEHDLDTVVVDTDLTTILMTAIDKAGRFVTTVKREDIRILEDDVPQQIKLFERETEQPLSLALMFDTSGSQARTLPKQKDVARVFLSTIFRPARDKVAVVSFAGAAILQQV